LKTHYSETLEEEAKLKEEKSFLINLSDFPFQFSILNGTDRTSSLIGEISTKKLQQLTKDKRANEVFLHVFQEEKNKSKIFILYVKEDAQLVSELIKEYSVDTINPPSEFTGFIEEETTRIEKRLTELLNLKNIIFSKIEELYKDRNKVLMLEDYYRSLSYKESATAKFLIGKETLFIKGFVKEEDYKKLEDIVRKSGALLFDVDIENKDVVPVSLKNSIIFKPFEFLVRMFGYPSYGNVDPTPLVAILFTIFFGFALGDAGYGLVLAILSLFFARKYKNNPGAWKFFMILLYGGAMAVVVGVLTNSYFGNIFSAYFPNASVTKVLESIAVINPTSPQGSVQFIIISIVVGFITQMIGIFVNALVKFRSKQYADAIFNSIGWLLFLPGLVLLLLGDVSPILKTIDNVMLYTGLVFVLIGGFISTRRPFFKPIAALVNLYGIRSSYGVSGFLGDTLSYLRLFALGLSSGILGTSFNLIAKVIGEMLGPIGFIFIIIALLVLHLLALFMNVLSAFIHSMRLNFLEFFGRFYDLGGYEFKPLGFESKNIILLKKKN
jgi:V/A-type H+-transporting ATPase subunit I